MESRPQSFSKYGWYTRYIYKIKDKLVVQLCGLNNWCRIYSRYAVSFWIATLVKKAKFCYAILIWPFLHLDFSCIYFIAKLTNTLMYICDQFLISWWLSFSGVFCWRQNCYLTWNTVKRVASWISWMDHGSRSLLNVSFRSKKCVESFHYRCELLSKLTRTFWCFTFHIVWSNGERWGTVIGQLSKAQCWKSVLIFIVNNRTILKITPVM